MNLLGVDNLKVHFFTSEGTIPAVDGISFSIRPEESVGMVGESGCGKSVTSLSIMRLVPPPGRMVGGSIWLKGEDLLDKSERQMQEIRGRVVSTIFQDPMTCLSPVMTVGDYLSEAIRVHHRVTRTQSMDKAAEMLEMVRIPAPRQRLGDYPHQMSGGMRQRVMIALALAAQPALLIADEPTTALDVTIQSQILDLMRRLKDELGMALLFITHDLGIVAEIAERMVVMYAGKIVEAGTVRALFREPGHPYTTGLLASLPRPRAVQPRLHPIPGSVPNPLDLPSGCRFHPRCDRAMDVCRLEEPPRVIIDSGHLVSCWLFSDMDKGS